MPRPKGSKNKKGLTALKNKQCITCGSLFTISKSLLRVNNCSWDCRNKEISKRYTGDGNPFFGRTFQHTDFVKKWKIGKGGITPKIKLLRKSKKYKEWRTKVFTRDNFTCRHCGINGVELNAHHIKPFSQYPRSRFVIKNGLTLCVPCHKATDSFLKRKFKII